MDSTASRLNLWRSMSKPIDIFKAEVRKMLQPLNMGDYDITVKVGKLKANDAEISADPKTRLVKIVMAESIDKDELHIRKVARHEMWHLFLAGYRHMARDRYVNEAQLDDEEERLCTILEKIELA